MVRPLYYLALLVAGLCIATGAHQIARLDNHILGITGVALGITLAGLAIAATDDRRTR